MQNVLFDSYKQQKMGTFSTHTANTLPFCVNMIKCAKRRDRRAVGCLEEKDQTKESCYGF